MIFVFEQRTICNSVDLKQTQKMKQKQTKQQHTQQTKTTTEQNKLIDQKYICILLFL